MNYIKEEEKNKMADYNELLNELGKSTETINVEGMEVSFKNCSDRERGCFDPRVTYLSSITKEELENHPENYEESVQINKKYLFFAPENPGVNMFQKFDMGAMREMMGWNSIDKNPNIRTVEKVVSGSESEVLIRIYDEISNKKDRACLIFFHGGGFMGGSMDVVENQCKDISAKADCVVISVDYRLCPENPYPAGFNDCFDVVKWVYENHEELGIHSGKIGVAGDSAGGNLAAVCTLKDRDLKTKMIAYEALLYPTVSRQSLENREFYDWDLGLYEIKDEDPKIIEAVSAIGGASNLLNLVYMRNNESDRDPYIAPLTAENLTGIPKTLTVSAEYDFLCVETQKYAVRLKEAGCDVRSIRYGGMPHAFFDKFGLWPQAEDCINEIVKDLKSL